MAIPSEWDLPESIRTRLGEEVGRQRAMVADGHVLLLTRLPIDDPARPGGIAFWRNPAGVWESTGQGLGIANPQALLLRYDRALEELQQLYDEANTAEEYFHLLEAIAPTERNASQLHQTLQSARELVKNDRELIVMRDHAYEATREVELLYTSARHALDFTLAKQGEEQAQLAHQVAQSTQRLNILVAMFLPVTALGAIFGMNLVSGLESAHASVFWMLLVVSLIIGLVVVLLININVARLPRLHHLQRTRSLLRDPWAKWKDDAQTPSES